VDRIAEADIAIVTYTVFYDDFVPYFTDFTAATVPLAGANENP